MTTREGKSMYTLIDIFNDRVISRHRTLEAAMRAEIKHDKAVKKHNGTSSYIPTGILTPAGEPVDADTYNELRYRLGI